MKQNKTKEDIPSNPKLDAAIRLLLEKLKDSKIEVEDKQIIIKNGKLTIN